jgi:hypothetical protein
LYHKELAVKSGAYGRKVVKTDIAENLFRQPDVRRVGRRGPRKVEGGKNREGKEEERGNDRAKLISF